MKTTNIEKVAPLPMLQALCDVQTATFKGQKKADATLAYLKGAADVLHLLGLVDGEKYTMMLQLASIGREQVAFVGMDAVINTHRKD